VARDILISCFRAGIFEVVGLLILSYLNLRELSYVLILCHDEIRLEHISTNVLSHILYINSKQLLEGLSDSFLRCYNGKVTRYNQIVDETNGDINYIENNHLSIFDIKSLRTLSPKDLLENLQITTDLSSEKKLSTKWKFDEAEIWETCSPSQVVFNPVFPIYAIVTTSTLTSYNYEFAIYTLPGRYRNDRGQTLFRRSNKLYIHSNNLYKNCRGKTIVTWSSDGYHLAVIDYLEEIKTRITIYRFFDVKGVFKKIKNVCIDIDPNVNCGWNPWFNANTILVPVVLSPSSPSGQTTKFQVLILHLNNTYEMFQIQQPIVFSRGICAPCSDDKHVFIINTCSTSLHTHDIIEFYDIRSSSNTPTSKLHIPGIVNSYCLSPSEHKLILMIRGNRHFQKAYEEHPTPASFECTIIESERVVTNPPAPDRDPCFGRQSAFTNYRFLIINLQSMEVNEMVSKVSLQTNTFGLVCDNSTYRFKHVSLSYLLQVSPHFLTVNMFHRHVHINRLVKCNLMGQSGYVKTLHPTKPMFVIRTGTVGYLDKQIYSFYLSSNATKSERKVYPKARLSPYTSDTNYTCVKKPASQMWQHLQSFDV